MKNQLVVAGIVASTITLGMTLLAYADKHFASLPVVERMENDITEIKRDVKTLLRREK